MKTIKRKVTRIKKPLSDKVVMVGKPASSLNEPWYKRDGNPTDIDHILNLPKPKAISYFKVCFASMGGRKTELQYWKTLSNGYMVYVDVGNVKMGVVQGLKSASGIVGCSKSDFTKAFKKVLKVMSL